MGVRFPSATHHAVLVMHLTATPLLCVSPAAAQDVAASAVAGPPKFAEVSARDTVIATFDFSHEER